MTAGIPAMLAKRNDVRAYKKISDKEVRLLFKRFRLRLSELRLDP
jgi:hypothetical protein